MPFLWVIFSYLLGSIPFGYLISRFSDQDILEIGWKKTSGSNVFKNVGHWQGILTGVLDLAKGYLAVYGAQKIGLSVEIQIFSGTAAVIGHNWSLFLRFAGGRGIGTFIGAFLVLSPQIILLSIIPLVVLALVWNAAIGTLLFLAIAVFLSFYLNQFETAGLFTIISLAPILIKRLSPLKEIEKAKNKGVLIRNRLLFDNNEALWDLRIRGWGWKAAKIGVKVVKKPIGPVKEIFSNGVKFILRNSEKVVIEITTDDFKKMMLAAAKKIVLYQEEINKINVWPVADRDTGYNLAATLLGVEGAIYPKNYSTFRELTQDITEAAMVNARGNAGMIYTGYLIEVLDRIKHLETIDAFHLALAMKRGIKAARLSIVEPVDGTILDVIKAAGEKAYEIANPQKEKNLIKILEEAHKISEVALKETKEKLLVLKENDVVDAGALGFVKILEAWIESLKGVPAATKIETTFPIALPSDSEGGRRGSPLFAQPEIKEKLKYRVEEDKSSSPSFAAARLYEVVSIFRKTAEINIEDLKKELSFLGDSLEVLGIEGKVKIHIHTNQPELVQDKFRNLPEFESRVEELLCSSSPLASARVVEDMEHSGLVGDESKDSSSPSPRAPRSALGLVGDESKDSSSPAPRLPLGLVVDEIADLPKEFLEKHDIIEVPFITRFPDGEIITSKEEIYQKMKEALKTGRPLPTTSAPSFKEFLSAFQKAFEKFEKILVITVSAKLSGAYSSARIARSIYKKPAKLNIYVFDCFTAEVGEGLVVMRAQELISQGEKMEEIIEELKEFCPQITLLACLNDFKYVVRGGRFKLPKIFLKPVYFIQKIGIKFVVELKNGKVKFSQRGFRPLLHLRFHKWKLGFRINLGKDISRILVEEIERQRRGKAIKAAIAYADNPAEAKKLKEELEKLPKIEIAFVSPVSPVVAMHTGPGALLVAFHFVKVDN